MFTSKMRTAVKVLAAAAPLALCSTSNAQEINDRFLSIATVSKAAKPKSSKNADAKADKLNASTATKAAKIKASSSGSQSLIGLWTGIDHLDGSTIRFSISCDDVALTNECEVLYSDDYWGTTYCGGMGVVNQRYELSSSGSLSADHNGPIICANGEEYTGYTEFNEIVLQSNGSLMWNFYNDDETTINFQLRFWRTSIV